MADKTIGELERSAITDKNDLFVFENENGETKKVTYGDIFGRNCITSPFANRGFIMKDYLTGDVGNYSFPAMVAQIFMATVTAGEGIRITGESTAEGFIPTIACTVSEDELKSYTDEKADKAYDDSCAAGNEAGTVITFTGAADARLQELEIYGKTELSQGSLISVGENGMTVNCGSTSAALSSGLPLRGVPVTAGREHNYTDENDQDWTGDIYDSKGKRTAYTALVDLGDLTWERRSGSGARYFVATPTIPSMQLPGTQNQIVYDLLCTGGYTSDTGRNIYYGTTDKTISLGGGTIAVYNAAYVSESAETFRAAVTGVKLLYIIDTPVQSDISAQDKAALRALRTAPGSAALTNTEDAHMTVAYLKDTVNGKALAAVQDDLQRQIDALA